MFRIGEFVYCKSRHQVEELIAIVYDHKTKAITYITQDKAEIEHNSDFYGLTDLAYI